MAERMRIGLQGALGGMVLVTVAVLAVFAGIGLAVLALWALAEFGMLLGLVLVGSVVLGGAGVIGAAASLQAHAQEP